MKVALLIAGYVRTFESNIDSLNKKILSKFDNVDIFFHVTKNESVDDKYYNNITVKNIEKIKSILKPKVVLEEENLQLFGDVKKNNLYNTWIKYYKLNQIKKDYETIYGKYDLVIKCRPDIKFLSDIDFDINPKTIYLPKDSKIDRSKLKNILDKDMCDIFAYGDSNSMDFYFEIKTHLDSITSAVGFVPETVIYEYLKNHQYKLIDIEYEVVLSKCNIFAICGDSGSGKSTIANLLKKYFSNSFLLECDRYHKWERYDPNWSEYTHLNPDANYISKMHEDIFNLKVGNTIYQVDYDHSTGKFTEQQTIQSSDNLIVCGLHSLYQKNDKLYDLSIFMDTDEALKYEWKIQRDIKKRGYTEEQIKKQIIERKNDYTTYIEPQKENSDIIVNFYYDKSSVDTNYTNLKISVNKKYSLSKILKLFLKYQIPFSTNINDKFVELHFKKYIDCELWSKVSEVPNKYYYYVLFVILNIEKENFYDL